VAIGVEGSANKSIDGGEDPAVEKLSSAFVPQLLTSAAQLDDAASASPDAVILFAIVPLGKVGGAGAAAINCVAGDVPETWEDLGSFLDERLPQPVPLGQDEENDMFHSVRTLRQAFLRSMLPNQATARFGFMSSARTGHDSDSSNDKGDCTELAASLGVAYAQTPVIVVIAPGVRRRLPDFAVADADKLSAYVRWLTLPAMASVGRVPGDHQADALAKFAAMRFEQTERSDRPATSSLLVIEVHSTTSAKKLTESADRTSKRKLSVVGRAARRRVDHHDMVAFAEITWDRHHDQENGRDLDAPTPHMQGQEEESASVVVASTCSGPEIVQCVESALLFNGAAASLTTAEERFAGLPLCCLGAMPVASFGSDKGGPGRVIDWVDQRSAPLLTELSPSASRELLPMGLPFVVLYLPGTFPNSTCDDDDTTADGDDGMSADGVDENRVKCLASRYAAVRRTHGRLLDAYEIAAHRFSFGDAEDSAECWDSVALGTETAARCHAESRRAFLFTWATADVHPNKTKVVALNIADYHSCKRYDFELCGRQARPPQVGATVAAAAVACDVSADDETSAGYLTFGTFFQDYLDGELEASYLCPPKVFPVDWSVAAALLVGFASLLETLLERWFALSQGKKPNVGKHQDVGDESQPMPNGEPSSSSPRVTRAYGRPEVRLPFLSMLRARTRPKMRFPASTTPPSMSQAAVATTNASGPRARVAKYLDGCRFAWSWLLGIPRQNHLVVSVAGGATMTAMIWAWDPTLLSVDTAALVLCIAVPFSAAKGLSVGSSTRRVLETAATAPIAAAAINPAATFQLISAASHGMGFACHGTCCTGGG
jgi:hypothetical protein